MSCKKGGFVSIRHNDLRDLAANKFAKTQKSSQKLTPLTGEELDNRTTDTTNEARLNIRARGILDSIFGFKGF